MPMSLVIDSRTPGNCTLTATCVAPAYRRASGPSGRKVAACTCPIDAAANGRMSNSLKCERQSVPRF